jgi:hypothetical protein
LSTLNSEFCWLTRPFCTLCMLTHFLHPVTVAAIWTKFSYTEAGSNPFLQNVGIRLIILPSVIKKKTIISAVPTVKASKLKWNCSSVFFVRMYLHIWNVGKSNYFQTFICFLNIFIIFIKLSSSTGQAAGLGAVGLILKNGIYHPADFVSWVTCYGCDYKHTNKLCMEHVYV